MRGYIGVQVTGSDGRAGMAAIVAGTDFTLQSFHDFLKARLPAYARPVFVRIVPTMELTGTFKQHGRSLLAEGYDPAKVGDLYLEDRALGAYVPLNTHMHRLLQAGMTKL